MTHLQSSGKHQCDLPKFSEGTLILYGVLHTWKAYVFGFAAKITWCGYKLAVIVVKRK